MTTISLADAHRPLYLGVDLGGTTIKIGLVDDSGRVVAWLEIPTLHENGPDDAIARIRQSIDDLLSNSGAEKSDIAAVGLGTPGTMDLSRGLMLQPPNLPSWRQVPIRDLLAEACGLPVVFCNDATAAACGEHWVGSGREFASMILITLGTGVGSGIILGDRSLDGENSHGAECGHTTIDCRESARMCSCGQRGHLEAYCSAVSVARRTEEALTAGRDSTIARRIKAGERVTARLVAEEAEQGDPLAVEIVSNTAKYLAVGIVNLMQIIDPGAIILGGAMNFGGPESPAGRLFLARVRQTVSETAFPLPASRITIDFARLGGSAGFIGAAGLARLANHRGFNP